MNTTQKPERIGDWLQTYTGIQFWPLDPRPEDIRIEDIAHALAQMCRFGGHTDEFYSVAQHSVHVCQLTQQEGEGGSWRTIALSALLHDATEAYLIDVPRPVKRSLTNYKNVEIRIADTIAEWFYGAFGIRLDFNHAKVKWADNVALATETRDLLGPKPAPWHDEMQPDKRRIDPLPPMKAKKLFLTTFDRLLK